MRLNLYELSTELIGELPIELEWVYGITTILLYAMVIFVCCVPFIVLYKVFDR